MAEARTASGLFDAAGLGILKKTRALLGNVRVIVIASLALISGTFASAALIQMRLDREHALSQAAIFETVQAGNRAGELSATLDRLAAIGRGFASASLDAEAAAALAEAGGPAMRNIAVLDQSGHLISELKGAPRGLLPLAPDILARARNAPLILAEGPLLALIIFDSGHLVAVQFDPALLFPSAPDFLIAAPSGQLFALGREWNDIPGVTSLALDGQRSATRLIELSHGDRLVSLAMLPRWPLAVGSSTGAGEALDAWYGALPLYFFFIFGPALAGAGLAAVFVREFERRVRAAEAVKSLRSTKPEEARLLVRLAEAERRMVHAERAKAEFMAHMSHELRTPLNAIIGFAEVIEEGMFGATGHPKYVEYARDIGLAGRQLHARIGDILDFADIDARRRPLATEAVDVSGIARECLKSIAAEAQAGGVRLLAALPEPAIASADIFAVRRILSNLLSNAVQFTPRGGEVRVSVMSDKGAVLAIVRDNGLGFSEEEKARFGDAFRRFARPGHSTGLGLGLAIATTLARRMGGNLRVTSAHGEGTTVELRLPAAADRAST